MTIHHKSRIPTDLDYSQFLFGQKIGCCCTGPYPTQPVELTYHACNALGGYFSLSDSEAGCLSCLGRGTTGCCCACSFGGMTSGIERCACDDLGGIWRQGPCTDLNEDSFCLTAEGNDVRSTKKCCGYTLQSGIVVSDCTNVCTEEECSKKAIQDYIPIFFPTSTCEENSDCPVIQGDWQFTNSSIITGNPDDDTYGNCCVQGNPCRCFQSITVSQCRELNGTLYLVGDSEFSCQNCYSNCTKGSF